MSDFVKNQYCKIQSVALYSSGVSYSLTIHEMSMHGSTWNKEIYILVRS